MTTGTRRPRTLLLDLDGTICASDEPVLAYGRRVAAHLPSSEGRALLTELTEFLDGVPGRRAAPPLVEAFDGYRAVELLAAAHGVPRSVVDAAYLESRKTLEDPAGIAPASGPVRQLLAELRDRVRVVLVTNAPAVGVRPLLDRLGVAAFVDDIITEANKPKGMSAIVERLLAESGATGQSCRLLSVGDIWSNDLAVPYARGCVTAYVDRFGHPEAKAHATGTRLEDLVDFIRAWSCSGEDEASDEGAGVGAGEE